MQSRQLSFLKWLASLFVVSAWMAGIFWFSSMPGGTSGQPLPFDMYAERKGAHIFEYAVLTLLLILLFWQRRMAFSRTIYLALSFSLIYACSDEFHQLFVPGREGRLGDILIDLVGIGGMALLSIFWFRNKNTSR